MINALSTEQNLRRLENRVAEVRAWRDRAALPFAVQFRWSAGEQTLREGEPWPTREVPVTMRALVEVPAAWQDQPLMLDLSVGGEALLIIGGEARGGLNPYHSEVWLETPAGTLEIEIEAVPKGLFGTPTYAPRLERARLLLPDIQVRALMEDLSAVHEAATELCRLGHREIADLLADALSAVIDAVPLPRGDGAGYLTRAWQEPTLRAGFTERWDEWNFGGDELGDGELVIGLPFPDELRPALTLARSELAAHLDAIRARYPAQGALALTGHAHIDLAWLWPLAETRRKARRTFSTVLALMERFPDFIFNQSSAQLYAYVEQDDPPLFARITERVREGRWDVVGGMWVEPDGNLISGESWVRQLLHGQRYFQSRFGLKARVCWLPDTFGYAANLPQLLLGAGMTSFFTTKLNWNETNTFPHDLYRWEALDGSQVTAHSFHNQGHGYNGELRVKDVLQTWQNFGGKRRHDTSLFSFGWGDGGGGPSAEMLERYARLRDFPGLPRLHMNQVANFYSDVKPDALPVWVGEQYLELHRGTYTTQAKVKELNRALEHALCDAEAAATLAHLLLKRAYPREEFTAAWEALLRNQFHDILPGSGVRAVYDDAHRELKGALEVAQTQRDDALQQLSHAHGSGERLVVWNLSLGDRPLSLRLPVRELSGSNPESLLLSAPDGSEVYTEVIGDELLVVGNTTVPGLGYLCLGVGADSTREAAGHLADEAVLELMVLENEHLRAEIAPDGSLASLIYKASGREALDGPGNQLWLYPDVPREWEGWELDASYPSGGERLLAISPPERLPGRLEQAVRVCYDAQGSEILQTYVLRQGSARLEIRSAVRWRGRRLLLRAQTGLNVRSTSASFETAFGTVSRSTHSNTSWDAAQFEVPGHRFADLSEADFGVSLLTRSKYGYNARGNVLGLSLLRGPLMPDPSADAGEHAFTYALYPHDGDWRNGTLREAHDLNAPLGAFYSATLGNAEAIPAARLLSMGHPALRLSALKLCEDDDQSVILRVYDAHGARGHLKPEGLGSGTWMRVNLLEDPETGELSFTPYKVLSLKSGPLEFEPRPRSSSPHGP